MKNRFTPFAALLLLSVAGRAQQPLSPAEFWNAIAKGHNDLSIGLLDYNIARVHTPDPKTLMAKIKSIESGIERANKNYSELLRSNPDDAETTQGATKILNDFKKELRTDTWLLDALLNPRPTYRELYGELQKAKTRSARLDSLQRQMKVLSNIFFRLHKSEGITRVPVPTAADSVMQRAAQTVDYVRTMDEIRIETMIYLQDFIGHTNGTVCDSVRYDITALEKVLPQSRENLKNAGPLYGDLSLNRQTERCLAITEAFLQKDMKRMLNLCKKWKDKSISSAEAADYNDIVNSKMGKVTAFWEQLGETRTAFMKKHMPGVRE